MKIKLTPTAEGMLFEFRPSRFWGREADQTFLERLVTEAEEGKKSGTCDVAETSRGYAWPYRSGILSATIEYYNKPRES
ncbi:MAG: hypothetical protein AABX04_06160 [Nanoarchaeota archaeon]